MILSALLTSVGINLAVSVICFALFSILRKHPGNRDVYEPRLVADQKSEQREERDFDLERLIPSAGWLRRAWQPSEDDLLLKSGFDAVVFMRILIFSMRIFVFAAVIGIFVLIPVNYSGNQLSFDFAGLQNKSIETFTISNVNDGSNRLWIHFSAVYVFTVFVCCLLYSEYSNISSKRLELFYSAKHEPQHFTILVRGIPTPPGMSIDECVESFFTENYPSSYLTHCVVHRTRKLKGLINQADKLYRKLVSSRSNNREQRFKRDGFLGLFGRKVDIHDHYGKNLSDIESNVRTEQSAAEEVRAAFVSFKTRLVATIASRIRQGENPTEWITEQAPHPQDIYWPFFSSSFTTRWVSSFFVFGSCAVLTISFFIPVLFVQGLTHLEQLEGYFPFLKSILRIKFVGQIVTGYLPSLVLQMFLAFVPPIMVMLSSIQGYIALSQIEKSACIKVLLFIIWNVFFANVLSGSVLNRVGDILLEPKKIPQLLGVAVPAQATFFTAYVVTSGWTGTSSELLRPFGLLSSCFKRLFGKTSHDDITVPSVPYHSAIPGILFFGLVGVTYFFLAPLILPFLLVFYCLAYIVYRHQLLNVYAPTYETGGKYWPIVHSSTIFSLCLMHVIAIGIFGLKKQPLASSLTIPLPILTLIFNNFCQRRFLPTFENFSAESLIKKDMLDQNDSTSSTFYEELENAYRDPAMAPRQNPRNDDSIHSPLLA